MYYAARDYRHNLIVPLATYFLYKVLFRNMYQILASLLFFLFPIYFQVSIILYDFFIHATRIIGLQFFTNTVPLGVLMSWGAVILFFTVKCYIQKHSRFWNFWVSLSYF